MFAFIFLFKILIKVRFLGDIKHQSSNPVPQLSFPCNLLKPNPSIALTSLIKSKHSPYPNLITQPTKR